MLLTRCLLSEIPENSKPRGRQISGVSSDFSVPSLISSDFDAEENLVQSGLDNLSPGNKGVPNSAIVKGVQQGVLGSIGDRKRSSRGKGGEGNNGGGT